MTKGFSFSFEARHDGLYLFLKDCECYSPYQITITCLQFATLLDWCRCPKDHPPPDAQDRDNRYEGMEGGRRERRKGQSVRDPTLKKGRLKAYQNRNQRYNSQSKKKEETLTDFS